MRATAAVLLLAALALGVGAQRRKQLTDDNFEGVTQAATGQTTGVWFVNFCSPSARTCKDLAGAWEALGKELLPEQVAFLTTVDVHASPRLRARFDIKHLPTLLLFRDRQMYRFTAKLPLADAGETAAALRAFIEGGYQGHGEPVPPPPSPFDWLLRGLQAKAGAVGAAMEARNAQALLVELAPVLAVGGLVALLVVGQLAARARSKPKRE